jgi:cytochrome c biogenesis factor
MIVVGELSLWIALLMAVWAATVSFAGGAGRRDELILSGERAAYSATGFTVFASVGLWAALFSRDFSLSYVASQISANLPNLYVFAAFWSGHEGSVLFSALILALCMAIAVRSNRDRNRELMPFVTGSLAVVLVFLLATAAFKANPFTRLDWLPVDGRGMNPRLQHPGMAAHPPMLYLGYLSTAVPFAFAIAAIAARKLDADWLSSVRRWSMAAWFSLTIGIVLGMWWSYVDRGWGGYWAWDPAENASLLPWLTGTAFLHSIMIQENRGLLRTWNVTLVVMTFLFSMVGTFITRSGLIDSGSSFAQSPVSGSTVTFLVVATALTVIVVNTRLKDLAATAGLVSPVTGVGPTIARRNRRRFGGHIVHAGFIVMFVAFAGTAFKRDGNVSLTAGQAFETTDPYGATWRFVSQGVSKSRSVNRDNTTVALEAWRDGQPMGLITTEKRQYFDSQQRPTFEPSTEAGVLSTVQQDVYVVLAGLRDEVAELRIGFNPLVVWLWFGGALMALGGIIVMWPQAERRPQ